MFPIHSTVFRLPYLGRIQNLGAYAKQCVKRASNSSPSIYAEEVKPNLRRKSFPTMRIVPTRAILGL